MGGVARLNWATEGLRLHDWFFRHGSGRKRLIDWLGIDAWIDSSLAESWQSLQDRWNGITSFFARFRLSGWKKLLNEAIAECLTLGVGGLAVLFILAIPALNEFDENKINTGYSVAQQTAAYYGRPATVFGPYARNYCNKCHAKD